MAAAPRQRLGPLAVRFVAGDTEARPRVAYAVSGAPNAVARNRVRRRLRAAVAEAKPTLRAGGAYLVSAAGGDAMRVPFDELVGTLATLLADAGGRR